MKPPLIVKVDKKYRHLWQPMLANDDIILVGARKFSGLALDRRSLEPRWHIKGMPVLLFPAVAVTWTVDQPIIGHSATDGREVWRFKADGRVVGSWTDHLLFLIDDRLQLRSHADGQVVTEIRVPWPNTFVGPVHGSLLLCAESADYESTAPPDACAIDLESGALRWQRTMVEGPTAADPTHIGFFTGEPPLDHFLFTYDRVVYCAGDAEGAVRWQLPFGDGKPVFLPAGPRLLKWTPDHLVGYDAATGVAVFDLLDERLVGEGYPRLLLLDGDRALLKFNTFLAAVDLSAVSVTNVYKLMADFNDAALVDGRTIVATGLDLRVFDESIWLPPRPRKAPEKKTTAPARRFKSRRVIAEILDGGVDEPLVFDTLAPIIPFAYPDLEQFGAMATSDGVLLAVSERDGTLHAFDAGTYELVWHLANSGYSSVNSPDLHGGFILKNAAGDLHGRSVLDGRNRWTTPCEDRWASSGDFIVTSCDHPARLQLFDPGANKVVLEFDRPLPRLRGVTSKIAILSDCMTLPSGLRPYLNPFAAIDLRDGRELWRRDLGTRPESTWATNVESIQDGVIVLKHDDGYEGVSVLTGETAWRTAAFFPGHHGRYWWGANVLDVATGDISSIRGGQAGGGYDATFDDYVVSFRTKGIYFLHRTRPHQLLRMHTATSACIGLQVGDDLVLQEHGKIRALRRVK